MSMRRGTRVRAIEYEVLPRDLAVGVGLTPGEVNRLLGEFRQVAVVKCVDERGQKLTAVGDADHLRVLLKTGEASDRQGMTLARNRWPVVVPGWMQAS